MFAKQVDSSGIPFHSPAMALVRDEMLAAMRRVVPAPKQRSSKWVSTSVPEDKWEDELALYCSADYHVNNACSPVLFHEALQKVPPSAITVEIAPHALMQVADDLAREKYAIFAFLGNSAPKSEQNVHQRWTDEQQGEERTERVSATDRQAVPGGRACAGGEAVPTGAAASSVGHADARALVMNWRAFN